MPSDTSDQLTAAADSSGASTSPPANAGTAWWQRELFAFLELLGLSGLLFAQPVLDWLGRYASDIVLARHPSGPQILLVVAIIVLGPPLVLWALEAVTGLFGASVRKATHAFLLAALTATLAYSIARRLDVGGVVEFLAAGASGIAMGVFVLRSDTLRTYLRFLAVAPIAFAVLFLSGPLIGSTITGDTGAAAADVPVKHPQRVMVIVLDELPIRSLLDGSGAIDARLYPNIAALADQSTWYRNTTSVAPYTRAAVPAILDGRYPTEPNAFPNSHEYPESLFTLLGKDFRMNVHEATNETVCPPSLCPRSSRGAVGDILRDAAKVWETQTVSDAPDLRYACDDTTEDENGPTAADRFLASLQPSNGPQLDYVHLILPHAPWHLIGSGQDYEPRAAVPSGLDANGRWTTTVSADLQHQRHLLQAQYIDGWLGKVIARLRAIGEYDSTSIVLTADHGVAFHVDASYRVPTAPTYSDILWVPLFVKAADQTDGRVDDRPLETIDVLPTVADLVGVRIPWSIDGHSASGHRRSEPNARFLEWPSQSPFEPPKEIRYRRWPATEGLERVLATPASNPTVSGNLALYGAGEFASLVGRDATPLLQAEPSSRRVTITGRRVFLPVEPDAENVPWADFEATLDGSKQEQVAILVNGTVAAVVPTQPGFVGEPVIDAVLPPSLFRSGENRVEVAIIAGTPTAPRLTVVPSA